MKVSLIRASKPMKEVEFTQEQVTYVVAMLCLCCFVGRTPKNIIAYYWYAITSRPVGIHFYEPWNLTTLANIFRG